jgi:hypothetical protein
MNRISAVPFEPVWSVPELPPPLFGGPANGNDVPDPALQAAIETANAPSTARRARRLRMRGVTSQGAEGERRRAVTP